MLKKNFDNINWFAISVNPNAIELIEANLDKIDWGRLSRNPNAMHILEANPDKINWDELSGNPSAIHLLCVLNREKMREQCKEFARELISYVLHPTRLIRFASAQDMDLEEYMELL